MADVSSQQVPHPAGERLHEFLLAAVRTGPDRPAVVEYAGPGDIRTTSYRQLARLAEEYADALAGAGLRVGDRVILQSDTSYPAIAMLIACSSLGAAFVPVGPRTPAHRLEWITGTVRPALHLRAEDPPPGHRSPQVASGVFGPDGIRFEPRPATGRGGGGWRLGVETDPAYVIFTSGTTGHPKGVVMSHRGVVAFYRGMLGCDLVEATDRVATTSPLQFDFSLLDIGLALGSGAAVVPVPRALLPWPRRFLRVLAETAATQVNGVPSVWRQPLLREPAMLAELRQIRGVLFCGEEFPAHEVRRLQELLPKARLTNCYGSTESMACSFAEVPSPLPDGQSRLPIGTAHAGAELMLVGEDGSPVEGAGMPGELHLRSPALFLGYWDDEPATRRALVPDPVAPWTGQKVLRTGDLAYRDDRGDFYFCGRVDSQVQIHGNRVELREIEHRLLSCPGVANAVALVVDDPDGVPLLAAVVVPDRADGCVDDAVLLSHCRDALPDYMIPQRVEVVSELPCTQNGKTDRKELAAWCRTARPTSKG
ncbi:AMP-dependent synthetase and ligase [Streptomyces lincolnensis]|uniref:AMP-dependent synthetase and ligase n=1 Tax=Streptomyces lincolnensis TaxID=1915 RepID=A0A1B1MPV0_STRLN|nr:AMP-binding protein [Streptomyces lincolnensis]ANS70537.1 AMP-dependent synthetase and ligase [Streptomyces lincolnensis]